MRRIEPYLPLSHGIPRVDDRRVVSSIIFVELAAKGEKPDQLMVGANHLKAHRTAVSILKGVLFPDVSDAPKAG